MKNSLENIIKLEINSPNYRFSGTFNRRITIIHGDSATGKSSLVRFIQSYSPLVQVTCDLDIKILTEDTWETTISGTNNAVIICDDLMCCESLKFASFCKKYLVLNNLYLVLITRASLENLRDAEQINNSGEHFNRLSISLNEICNFVCNGKEHWLEHDYMQQSDVKSSDLLF